MELVEAIRLQALLEVTEGNFLYLYRRICRWFSATYHMPLPEVEELAMEYVLQHYFEHQCENMSKAERKKLMVELTETEAERKKREKAKKSKDDDAFLKRMVKEAKAREAAEKQKREQKEKAVKQRIEELSGKEMVAPPQPPDISMRFDGDGNLLEEESLPIPPRKR